MRRGATVMGSNLEATEIYMRIGLKAQAQCRANLEAIAEIKNPKPVFAKQTNIANGPQQVNNGGTALPLPVPDQARAEENPFSPNKILEGAVVKRVG
jgi:hypothetical protein